MYPVRRSPQPPVVDAFPIELTPSLPLRTGSDCFKNSGISAHLHNRSGYGHGRSLFDADTGGLSNYTGAIGLATEIAGLFTLFSSPTAKETARNDVFYGVSPYLADPMVF